MGHANGGSREEWENDEKEIERKREEKVEKKKKNDFSALNNHVMELKMIFT